jgi:hypothetical protein
VSPRPRVLALLAAVLLLLGIAALLRARPGGRVVTDAGDEDPDASAARWFAPRLAFAPGDGAAPSSGSGSSTATTDPEVLSALEAGGLALGDVLGGPSRPDQVLTNRGLYANAPAYRDVVDVLERDLAELSARPHIGEGADFGNHAFPARSSVSTVERSSRRAAAASFGWSTGSRPIFRGALRPTCR